MTKIKAVSFDLWDTLVIDDSDEPRRKAQGLRTKKQERRHLLWQTLDAQAPIPKEIVDVAFDVHDASFNKVWHDQHVTWPLAERVDVLLDGIGRTLPTDARAELVEAFAAMEVEIPPDPIDGAVAALANLAERYKLCICSDAVFTPGTGLRKIIEQHGMAPHFSGYVFSDEVPYSKPHRAMFDAVADTLDVGLDEIVHIGDRQHNDIAGPQALGMKGVLFTASRDVDRPGNTADAVCERHADLPEFIDGLAK